MLIQLDCFFMMMHVYDEFNHTFISTVNNDTLTKIQSTQKMSTFNNVYKWFIQVLVQLY